MRSRPIPEQDIVQAERLPAGPAEAGRAVSVRLLVAREAVSRMLSQQSRTQLGDYLVGVLPHGLQRASEYLFDFPITHFIRSSRILLVRIPRTGSVSTSMQIYGRVVNIPHRTALFYRNADPAFFESVVKIAVVRNPWDRLLSAYEFLRNNGASLAKPNPQTARAMSGLRSLEQLVFDYLEPNLERLDRLDPTLHHQHRYVCDDDGKIIVDRIFHTEDFAPMNAYLSSLGVNNPVPHLNERSDARDGRIRMTPSLADAIGRIYARDAALFGYGYAPK